MAFRALIRDNLNSMSFNMLLVTLLDLVVFILFFVLTLPLPDVFRRGYANFFFNNPLVFAFFMMFCIYNILSTVLKNVRSVSEYHERKFEKGPNGPRNYYKKLAKHQRDILLCIIGCGLSYFLIILSSQFRRMKTEKIEEAEVPEEKSADEKKNDCLVC